LFNSDDYCPTGQQLKAWLTGGGVITTDKALFDISDYSGTILTDLFGDHGQFADTRNVMSQIERDLETKLDWVAANHYDTANRVREDGAVLYIPREYISHGMREAAEHIATLELGPATQIDVAKKLAKSVKHERFTSLGLVPEI